MNQPIPGTARAAFDPQLHVLIDTLGIRFIESDKLESSIGDQMNLDAAGSYFPRADVISVRRPSQIYSSRGINGILLHEIGHWTGAKGRCQRPPVMSMQTGPTFPTYLEVVQEEAIAELVAVKLLDHFKLKSALADYTLQMMLLANPPYDMELAIQEADKAVRYVLDALAAAKNKLDVESPAA